MQDAKVSVSPLRSLLLLWYNVLGSYGSTPARSPYLSLSSATDSSRRDSTRGPDQEDDGMSAGIGQGDRTVTVLNGIGEMIANRVTLPEVMRAVAEATRELTGARWAIFLVLPSSRPAEFYGPPDALPLGPDVLKALEQILADGSISPQALEIEVHCSEPRFMTALVVPTFQGQSLREALVALYDAPPPDPPLVLLNLIHNQARIALETWRMSGIISESYTSTIRALASAIDARDPNTHRHSQAVTELSVALAEELHLDPDEIDTIRYAAILHDVGKIGIGEEILFKPGPLTPRERTVVEAHPLVGASILAGIPHMEELIPLILHHHERYDGSGYPDGLKDGDPRFPLGAQILSIADTFDAITTERPYHKGMTIDEACTFLQTQAGRSFHPNLVKAFITMIQNRLTGNGV